MKISTIQKYLDEKSWRMSEDAFKLLQTMVGEWETDYGNGWHNATEEIMGDAESIGEPDDSHDELVIELAELLRRDAKALKDEFFVRAILSGDVEVVYLG